MYVCLVLQANPNAYKANRPNKRQANTALLIAAQTNQTKILQLLLKYGANVNYQNGGTCQTILHIAAANHNVNAMKIILEFQYQSKQSKKNKLE